MSNIIKASSFSPLNLKPQLIKLFLHYVIKHEPRSALLYVQFLNHRKTLHIAEGMTVFQNLKLLT